MRDYISREAVLEEMKTWVCRSEGERKMLEITKKWLKGYPAADVVEVVRCKDCKYYDTTFIKERKMCWRKDSDGLIAAYVCLQEDFCSYGERREDD